MTLPSIIEKQLKDYVWSFDFAEGNLYLFERDTSNPFVPKIVIPKTQMFSLFRFLIRVAYRLSQRRKK